MYWNEKSILFPPEAPRPLPAPVNILLWPCGPSVSADGFSAARLMHDTAQHYVTAGIIQISKTPETLGSDHPHQTALALGRDKARATYPLAHGAFALAIEDTTAGAEAALSAGLFCVHLVQPGDKKIDFTGAAYNPVTSVAGAHSSIALLFAQAANGIYAHTLLRQQAANQIVEPIRMRLTASQQDTAKLGVA